MKTPLTTKQAIIRYSCSICKDGGECGSGDCVESSTCSYKCPECGGRIWFLGDIDRTPRKCNCPYCKKDVKL